MNLDPVLKNQLTPLYVQEESIFAYPTAWYRPAGRLQCNVIGLLSSKPRAMSLVDPDNHGLRAVHGI